VVGFDTAAAAALMDELTAISQRAAAAIKRVGETGDVRIKDDGSPVTPADEAAETVIRDGLADLDPALPIVSEEQAARERPRVDAGSYFLVDPLDGTREFIAGRDEYAINIALVTDGTPLLGIINAPALGLIWRGVVGRGAERIAAASGAPAPPQAIHTRRRPAEGLVAVVSRSHLDAGTLAFLARFPGVRRIASGSAIKFCRVAEGAADIYPRLAPTHDWDVAAGDAIITAAGGRVVAPDGARLRYGTADLIIPGFIACGDQTTIV